MSRQWKIPAEGSQTLSASELEMLLGGFVPAILPCTALQGARACAQGDRAALLEAFASDAAAAGWLVKQTGMDTLEASAKAAGWGELERLILTMPLLATGVAEEPDWVRMARRDLAVATAARWVCLRAGLPIDPEAAYAAGLVHDIGLWVLAQLMPRSYQRVAALAAAGDASGAQAQRAILGVDHATAGRRVTQLWNLPAVFWQAAWLHHQPPETLPSSLSDRQLVLAVALASCAADATSASMPSDADAQPYLQALGLTDGDWSELRELTAEAFARAGQEIWELDADELTELGQLRAAELARLSADLSGRCRQSADSEVTLSLVQQFLTDVDGHAGAVEALSAAADMLGGALGGRDVVVVGYCLVAGGGLALRRCQGQADRWRSFAPSAQTARPVAAASDLPDVLNWPADELGEWIDLRQARHLPLVSGGQWVGGLLCDWEPGRGADAIAATAAMALGSAVQRAAAVELGEQLAGASEQLARTQQQLAEARTLAMIGEMAAGAAHEMNTPLAVISGRAQLMREQAADEKSRRVWQTVAQQAQRVSDIITDLMNFASPARPQPQAIDAGQLLSAAKETFAGSNHPQAVSAVVDIEIEPGAGELWADLSQVKAVLVELISNAANAAGDSARVHLSARADELAGTVALCVSDEGPGMDEATAQQAFTPFFSLQAAGRRRGLGLSTAKRLIEINGGRIWLRSQKGKGAEVQIRLPRHNENGNERPADPKHTGS